MDPEERYLLVLPMVRMQRVQTLTRNSTPSTVRRLRWIFALNARFVCRFEKLTLCPNDLVLPQRSHVPAMIHVPFLLSAPPGAGVAIMCGPARVSRHERAGVIHRRLRVRRQPGNKNRPLVRAVYLRLSRIPSSDRSDNDPLNTSPVAGL